MYELQISFLRNNLACLKILARFKLGTFQIMDVPILWMFQLNHTEGQVMAVKKVSEIIEMNQSMHSFLQQKLRKKIDSTEDTRVSAALEYLDSVENKLTVMIEEIPQRERENMMATYIRYYPVEDEAEAQAAVDDINSNNINSLMDSVLKVSQKLVDISDFCETEAHTPELQKLFTSIRDFEAAKLHDISRELNEYRLEK